jgi:hypothetical protein
MENPECQQAAPLAQGVRMRPTFITIKAKMAAACVWQGYIGRIEV